MMSKTERLRNLKLLQVLHDQYSDTETLKLHSLKDKGKEIATLVEMNINTFHRALQSCKKNKMIITKGRFPDEEYFINSDFL